MTAQSKHPYRDVSYRHLKELSIVLNVRDTGTEVDRMLLLGYLLIYVIDRFIASYFFFNSD